MALFGSSTHAGDEDHDGYASPMDEEQKPLTGSSTEGDDTSPGPRHHEIYALNRSIRRTNLFLKIIIGLLSLTIIVLLSTNIPKTLLKDLLAKATCPTFDTTTLIKTPVPQIPIEVIKFESSPKYAERPNPTSDAAWDALLPDGRGFVYVPHWESYDLPPGENTTDGMIYSVALFHQMHCLGQLRRFSYMFLDAIKDKDKDKMEEIKLMFVDMGHSEHMTHCFDYLRQTIACAGDMALEWPRTEPTGERVAVDGWGIPHECKSWSHISDYMDKNHFDHSMVSEIAPLIG